LLFRRRSSSPRQAGASLQPARVAAS